MQQFFSFAVTIEDEIKNFVFKLFKIGLLVLWLIYAVNMLMAF